MIDKTNLFNLLAAPSTKKWVYQAAKQITEDGFLFIDLLELTLNADNRIAFHAAWLLDTLITQNLSWYRTDINILIHYAGQITHHSCHRHYVRIFMHLTSSKAPENVKSILAEVNLEPVVELCFDWLINPKTKVAVKVFAGETLCHLRNRHNWITEELKAQLHHLMRNGSPAIQVAGHRLLKQL